MQRDTQSAGKRQALAGLCAIAFSLCIGRVSLACAVQASMATGVAQIVHFLDGPAFEGVEYGGRAATLTVYLRDGTALVLLDVPPCVFEAFMASASKEEFFYRRLRRTFSFARVEKPFRGDGPHVEQQPTSTKESADAINEHCHPGR